MKRPLLILLCGAAAFALTACGNKSAPATQVPAASSANETPYKQPSANGGNTAIVGDRTSSPAASSPSNNKTTSDTAADYVLEDDLGGVNILRYVGEGGKVSIPSMIDKQKVLKIDEHAFRGAEVTNVIIPATVKTIETHAFSNCSKLEILTVADGVEVIDGYAFADCAKLTLVTLPDSIKEIGSGAFRNCPNIMLTYKGQTYTAVNIKDLYDIF